uniref:Uncharacterized protein n=1 Tax=Oryza glumipatula TaxID=40148 RepID=A0A0D9Y9T8_9ORYZ
MRRHLNTVKNNANATAEFSTQSSSQIMKGAHKRYHKLCWLWCYPSLFRNRDTEWHHAFYGSWMCSSTVLISEGDAVSDGVRTRHKGNDQVNRMDHDQRQRVSCAMGRESPLLSPPTCRWSHAPSS